MPQIRWAAAEDEEALGRIRAATWTADVSPARPRPPGTPFFGPRAQPENVLVAEEGDVVLGYATLIRPTDWASQEHVLELGALAIDPGQWGKGVGRQLVEAVVAEARRQGARKLTLHVLGPNTAARRLYEKCGFSTEGILRDEFLLDGQYVDDVLMACWPLVGSLDPQT